jgi:hypothetical protein
LFGAWRREREGQPAINGRNGRGGDEVSDSVVRHSLLPQIEDETKRYWCDGAGAMGPPLESMSRGVRMVSTMGRGSDVGARELCRVNPVPT